MKIGFVGLGAMGRPMAEHILKAGHELIVWNRSPERQEPLLAAGAHAATSACELSQSAELIGLCVSMPADARSVVLGEKGLLQGAQRGTVIVDFSSIDPNTSRAIASTCADQGVAYLDAPVSGGVKGAQSGTLTIIVGGATTAFEQAQPLFQAVGKKIVHVGPGGAGSTIKAINQLLVGINLAAVCEAYVLGQRAGIDLQLLFDILSTSAGDSAAHRRAIPDFVLKRSFEPGFAINLLCKDLDLALSIGQDTHTGLPITALVRQFYEEARAHNLGDHDITAAILPLESRYGL